MALQGIYQLSNEPYDFCGITIRPNCRTNDIGNDIFIFTRCNSENITNQFEYVVKRVIHNDGTIALSCGTKGVLDGVVVICGTGTISIAYRNGVGVRAAGWGPRLGDVGCGYDIGSRVLKAATFAHDGRGPETMILKELLEYLHLNAAEELIPWVYDKSSFSWQKIANLAPVAQKCAEAGDKVAIHIFEKSAAGLANSICAAAKRQGFKEDDTFDIVYAGGLLNSGVLVPYLNPILQAKWKNAKIINPDVEPVMGAVYLNSHLRKAK